MRYVVKIGGSLLNQGAAVAVEWLRYWLQWAQEQPVLLVLGGGAPVDALRHLAQGWPLDEEFFHRWALEAMDANAAMVVTYFQLASIQRLAEWHTNGLAVWSGSRALATVPELHPSWRTTSDTIAAWLGAQGDAPVIIVKALDPPCGAALHLTGGNRELWAPYFDEELAHWIDRTTVWWSGPGLWQIEANGSQMLK
jgi:aspartokinase-like uncharacterized kinase